MKPATGMVKLIDATGYFLSEHANKKIYNDIFENGEVLIDEVKGEGVSYSGWSEESGGGSCIIGTDEWCYFTPVDGNEESTPLSMVELMQEISAGRSVVAVTANGKVTKESDAKRICAMIGGSAKGLSFYLSGEYYKILDGIMQDKSLTVEDKVAKISKIILINQ